MTTWLEDLLTTTAGAESAEDLFARIASAAASLGFEYCAYGLRAPLPLSNPRTAFLNNYPCAWCERYAEAGYVHVDPTVRHATRSQAPLLWSDMAFHATPKLWEEARGHGLRHGWAQGMRDANGLAGMLTLARPLGSIDRKELKHQEVRMRCLASFAHMELPRLLAPQLALDSPPELTGREVEVLKWTADGKTAGEISNLLSVSENTVNFHVKNAVSKLCAANKTAAVVRAAMLGLLT